MSSPVSAFAMLATAMLLAGCPFAMNDDYYTVSQISPSPSDGGVDPCRSAARPCADAGCKGKECGGD